MSKLPLSAVIAALCLIATGAQAQTTAAPGPRRLALARQIFEAQGGMDSAVATVKRMTEAMVAQSKTPETRDRMAKVTEAISSTFMPRLFDDIAGFYAADFTEAQLKDILAFLNSPTGQAMKEKRLVIAQQVGESMAKLMPKFQLSVLEKACAENACSDQQKQQLAALEQQIPQNERL